MGSDEAQWTANRSTAQMVPVDLLVVGALCGVALLLVSFGLGGPLRVFAAAVLLWFLPGYVTVSALFPRSGDESTPGLRRLSIRERIVLAIGVSLALSVLAGLVLGTVTAQFTPALVLYAVMGYVAVVGLLAAGRRFRIPARDRFSLPVDAWMNEVVGAFTTGSLANRLLTLGLVLSVLLTVGAFGFAVGAETPGQTYTDFHLVTPDGDGDYVSAGYPDELNESEPATLAWGVHNAEAEQTDYTVVVVLERVVQSENGTTVIESEELNRTSVSTSSGERTVQTQTVRPTLVGEDLRLGYYLYRGDAPDRPDAETAYRNLHVWVTVTSTS